MALPDDIVSRLKANTSASFRLIGVHLSAEDMTELAALLKDDTHITEITLAQCRIDDAGAIAIADMIASNATLRGLYLSVNDIGPEGAIALAEALKENETLNTLYLVNNAIKDEGVAALAKALTENSSLKELNLKSCGITDAGGIALAEALKQNETLEHLDLSENSLNDDAAIALTQAVGVNQGLANIEVDYNDMELDDAKNIMETVRRSSIERKRQEKEFGKKEKITTTPELDEAALNALFRAELWVGKTGDMQDAWEKLKPQLPQKLKKRFDFSAALQAAREQTLASKNQKPAPMLARKKPEQPRP